MCGIAGVAGFDDRNAAERTLRAMIDAIAYRGPDSVGVATWPSALLGHRRLSIIDLSDAGRQPLLSDDARVAVSFNGCIYNFLELRKELENCGHSFRSNTDTEVLVRGYEQWGMDALVARLRGMFALAIWDDRRETLFLVRDRLGVKPLVYCAKNGQIAFASTVGALRAAGLVDEVDPAAVLEYLEFGYVTDERTIFQGAEKLPAATILEWRNGSMQQRQYWSLAEPDETSPITFADAVDETERLLLEAVRLRLYADVPIGALLSGGIDSTLVCWAMAKLNANVTAFTVSTPDDPEDEAPATVETARILGIPHQIVVLPKERGAALDELTSAYSEPFGCSSALAMLRVSRAVKPYATVLLTGDGGDDIFLGYSFHRHCLKAQQIARKLPGAVPAAWRVARPAFRAVPALRRPTHFADYVTGGLGAMTRAHDGLPYYDERGLLGDRLRGLELPHRKIPLAFSSARNLMQDFLNYQQRMWFTAEFMTKVDGGTMFYALEARSPFLDHVLWDFAAKLPPQLRLQGGVLKAILREIVRRRVSPSVASRKKQGFTIPVERWLVNQWSQELHGLKTGSLLEREGWLRRGSLEGAVKQALSAQQTPRQIWFLIALEHWLRKNDTRATAVQPGVAPAMTSS